MELRQLAIFVAVAEELHFGRAAELLQMAQPPVSRAVQQLERSIGHALFARSTRHVALTPAGEALLVHARRMLALEQEAASAVERAGSGRTGTVRLAFPGVSASHLVGILARHLRQAEPGIHLELSSQHFASGAIERLAAGEADLAFVRSDAVPDGVSIVRVFADRLMVAMPRGHALAEQSEVAMSELRSEQWVMLPRASQSVLVTRLHTLAESAGFTPAVVQEAPDTATAISLVTAGVGITLTLGTVAAGMASPHVAYVPLSDDAGSVDLLLARGDAASAAVQRVLDAVPAAFD